MTYDKCEIQGCIKQREHNRLHYCAMHRRRYERHGNFHTVHRPGPKKKEQKETK